MAGEQTLQRPRTRSKTGASKPARRRTRKPTTPMQPAWTIIGEAERIALQAFVVWVKGDPNLSVWEANFINDLGYHLVSDARYVLSPRRQQKIDEIGNKLGYADNAPPRLPDDLVSDCGAEDADATLGDRDGRDYTVEDDGQDWHRMFG